MHWTSLLALTALAEAAPQFGGGGGLTMLRFGCTQVVIDRLDPLVNPGQLPSTHVHQIVGGNGFNASMTTGDVSETATCTTCQFADDFSNYWTANLYFKARNGTFKRVPQFGSPLQFGDQFSTQTNGGILVYYVSAQPGKITAFAPGFRMLVGDPADRERPASLKRQNCFRCYTGPNHGGDVGAPCQDAAHDHDALPNKVCPGGIRSNVLFPTCWDGKNLDTPNHKDHVAYPVNGPATFLSLGGNCPDTHPVRIPQLMYEVNWDTSGFNDQSQWPEDGSQPFVLSMGDPTGFGQHADYVFGWKDKSLQSAMDTSGCFGAQCANLRRQSIDQARSCTVPTLVNEDVDGWLTTLPGVDVVA
ncbi:hypothetical protein SAPIO_CDS2203 [Scedosporium apiospermum]|uniref:DUF1996 domain-containing protein n=1 Tax=Pseudallescheria apiosperma TaxID=563466 RepID=A0A084GDG2_PSEDA|nr:uncharacterized protein SAPIO_CDS2203 [Scedosporium apiospermum]KEZ45374.1 hypothetical protein SAPIO_CDS2203 [Scedosporium apiospermum]